MWKSFSKEVKLYLLTNTLFSFGNGMSMVFLSLFLWKLDPTFNLLAVYSFSQSLAILVTFSFCAWVARKTSPMTALRLGIFCHLAAYLLMLVLQSSLKEYVLAAGFLIGLAVSLFAVGGHMAALDLVNNRERDRFLYVQGIMATIGGMIAPVLAGFLIDRFEGSGGYLIVFGISCILLLLAILFSWPIAGHPVEAKSYLKEVIKGATAEWKWMYSIMFCDGLVGGVYMTFLITMMTYQVAGNELNLGFFNMGAEGISILAFFLLAKISKPENRIAIFSIGAVGLLCGSFLLAFLPILFSLVLFAFIKPVTTNMINTSMNAILYSAIERDPLYKQRRLDYIIVREIPLGVGRLIGVALFLWMKQTISLNELIPVSFTLFPIVYVLMVPFFYYIHRYKIQHDHMVFPHL